MPLIVCRTRDFRQYRRRNAGTLSVASWSGFLAARLRNMGARASRPRNGAEGGMSLLPDRHLFLPATLTDGPSALLRF